MLVDIVTIFPGFFASPLATGLLGKAGERGLVEVHLHDLRDWATDRHRSVDDAPAPGSTPSTTWRPRARPGSSCSPPTAGASTTRSPSGWRPSPG